MLPIALRLFWGEVDNCNCCSSTEGQGLILSRLIDGREDEDNMKMKITSSRIWKQNEEILHRINTVDERFEELVVVDIEDEGEVDEDEEDDDNDEDEVDNDDEYKDESE